MNKLFYKLLCVLMPVFPIKRHKIFMQANYGGGYGCNPKYIAAEIIRQELDYDIYWAVAEEGEHNDLPEEIHQVIRGSLREIYHRSTAQVWVDNSRKTLFNFKKKRQIYIQTWHGSMSLKRVESDAAGQLDVGYILMAKHDSQMADVILSGAKASSEIIRRAFWYDGEILEVGTPRSDILFSSDVSSVRRKLSQQYIKVLPHHKILMYAPTFRRDGGSSLFSIDYAEVLQAVEKRFHGEWALLLRMHPNMLRGQYKLNIPDGLPVVDVTRYNDMQELLSVTDVLITDYSSTMFDLALVNRPCFLYVPDLYTYDRNTYYTLGDLPFPCALSQVELSSLIMNFDERIYLEKVRHFNKHVIHTFENGTASARVVDYIKDKTG